MKIATLALTCSLLGTAAFAQDATTAPAVDAQPKATITVLINNQPPFRVSLEGRLTDGAEFEVHAKKITVAEKTTTLENDITLSVKKQGKVLWNLSVPEGTVILPIKTPPSTQAPK